MRLDCPYWTLKTPRTPTEGLVGVQELLLPRREQQCVLITPGRDRLSSAPPVSWWTAVCDLPGALDSLSLPSVAAKDPPRVLSVRFLAFGLEIRRAS